MPTDLPNKWGRWVRLMEWLFRISLLFPVAGWGWVALLQLRGGWRLVLHTIEAAFLSSIDDECLSIEQSAQVYEGFFNPLLSSTWVALILFGCCQLAKRKTRLANANASPPLEGWRRWGRVAGIVMVSLVSCPAAAGWLVVLFRFIQEGRGWVNVRWAIGELWAQSGELWILGRDCDYWRWLEPGEAVFFDGLFEWTWIAFAGCAICWALLRVLRYSV